MLFSFCAPHEMLTFVLGTFVIAFLALIVAVKETAFFNPEDLQFPFVAYTLPQIKF